MPPLTDLQQEIENLKIKNETLACIAHTKEIENWVLKNKLEYEYRVTRKLKSDIKTILMGRMVSG